MKIVLAACNASYVHTNLAVRAIGAALRRDGHTAVLVERSLKDRTGEFLRALVSERADVYGFSVYIWNREVMLKLAAEVKLLLPSAKIVLGGPEVSFEGEDFFRSHPYVDNILAGEGETGFPAFVRDGAPHHTVVCAEESGAFLTAGILYDLFPPGEHCGEILYYESARGCPFRCSYCLSGAEGKVRAKDAETVIREVTALAGLGKVQIVKFVDRTFNFDRRRADAVWRAIGAAGLPCAIHFEICAELLDEENFRTLASLPKGCIQLEIGVQSANPDTLRAVGRSPAVERVLTALGRLTEMGNVHIHADLIAGLPHEDYASFSRSFDEVFPRCHHLQLGFLKLLPGTRLRREYDAAGCLYSPFPPYEILQTDAISYPELCRLHAIDDVLQRFGTEKWRHSLSYMLRRESSPFAFFEGLADECGDVRALSQRDAFALLRRYSAARHGDSGTDDHLALDWLANEQNSVPCGIRLPPPPDADALCGAYAAAHPDTPRAMLTAVSGAFGTAVVDRRRHVIEFTSQN